MNTSKPRILLMVDKWNWAFHTVALAISQHLSDQFEFTIICPSDNPQIDDTAYEIIHVLYEYETYHLPFLRGNARILRGCYNHYWNEWGMTPKELYDKYLRDAHAVHVPNFKLLRAIGEIGPPVYVTPEGVDMEVFKPWEPRQGPLVVGWAGNQETETKRFPWMQQAVKGICEFKVAGGGMDIRDMPGFFRSIDVICCSAKCEGSPRPLIEGMSCGNFPVSFDVGCAHELIDHGVNGLLVQNESVEGMRKALEWCRDHVEHIRGMANHNRERIRATRQWNNVLMPLREIYISLL
jgi:glycosyltransferase involved in cell wall biosynthesis